MLIFGEVSAINNDDYTVKLKCNEYDDFETPWLIIPQLWSRENKTGWLPEIQTLAAAYLNEDMTEGFLVSALYNDKDVILTEYNGMEFIRFSDGITFCHEPGSGKLQLCGDIEVTGNITCFGDVSDKTGTMQSIRDWANAHVHSNGNNGGNTGIPTSTCGGG